VFGLNDEDRRALEAAEKLLWEFESDHEAPYRTRVDLWSPRSLSRRRLHANRHARSRRLPSPGTGPLGRSRNARHTRAHRKRRPTLETDSRATRLRDRGLVRLPSRPPTLKIRNSPNRRDANCPCPDPTPASARA
jgi:hypothetical protein